VAPAEAAPVERPATVARSSSARLWAWLPGLAGGGCVVAAGVLAILSRQHYDALESMQLVANPAAYGAEGNLQQTLAFVFAGAGAAGLTGAIILFVVGGSDADVQPHIAIAPGLGSVGITGRW
jgi:hypothetical protein